MSWPARGSACARRGGGACPFALACARVAIVQGRSLVRPCPPGYRGNEMVIGRRACIGAVLAALSFLPVGCGGTTTGSSGTTTSGPGGTAGAAGAAGGTGVGGAGSEQPLCERYCDAVMSSCTGARAVYASREVCLAVCATLPPGKEGDEGTNTVQCRLRKAQAIPQVGEPDVECPAAGPGGDGACGTNCEGFCSIASSVCAAAIVTSGGCPALCAPVPDLGGYTSNVQSGNSVQCRLYHASAATLDPGIHCSHVRGLGPCTSSAPP
jgi:hypothetical protein